MRLLLGTNVEPPLPSRTSNPEEHLRRVIDCMLGYVAVLDPEGTLLFVNQAALQTGGLSLDDVVGKKFWETYWWNHDPIVVRDLKQAVEKGAAGEPSRYDVTVRIVQDQRLRIDFMLVPLRDPSGEITHLVPSGVDIQERYMAERLLRQNRNLLQGIIDHAEVPIGLRDLKGTVLLSNRQYASQFSKAEPKDIVGKPVEEVANPEVAARLRQRDAGVVEAGQAHRFEDKLEVFGHEHEYVAMDFPLRESDGSIYAVGTIATDISDIKRAERALQQADRRKDEFLAMLGHELRNPLSAMRSATEVMKLCRIEDERLFRIRDILDRQTTHMSRLVDGLLEVSRIVQGRLEVELGPVNLANLLVSLEQDSAEILKKGNLSLDISLPGEALWAHADEARMRQVFDNLLGNAIKFTAPGGHIKISAGLEAGQIDICFSDTGVGIESEVLPLLFKPFQQGQQPAARTSGGLGLGLALVKGLMDLHGGSVSARSDGPHCGSEFHVRLPSIEPPAFAQKPQRPAGATGLRVLVVEDNPDAMEALRDLLELMGHFPLAVDQAHKALALLRKYPVDLVLCDIGLPDMDGYELARAILTDATLKQTRLVAVTGYGQPEDRRRALEAGFVDHLVKPIDITHLNAILTQLTQARANQGN